MRTPLHGGVFLSDRCSLNFQYVSIRRLARTTSAVRGASRRDGPATADRFRGHALASGFVLTRQEAAGKWGAATYSLVGTGTDCTPYPGQLIQPLLTNPHYVVFATAPTRRLAKRTTYRR